MAKQVDKNKRRAQILEAAISVFAQRGYAASTMDEIADRATMSKGALYLYFKNKEALFAEAFHWFGQMAEQAMQGAADEALTPRDKLLAMAHSWGHIAAQNQGMVPLFLEFWSVASMKNLRTDYARELAELYAEIRGLVAQLVSAGRQCGQFRPDCDPNNIAFLFTGALDGLFLQCWLSPNADIEDIIDAAARTIVAGIDAV